MAPWGRDGVDGVTPWSHVSRPARVHDAEFEHNQMIDFHGAYVCCASRRGSWCHSDANIACLDCVHGPFHEICEHAPRRSVLHR